MLMHHKNFHFTLILDKTNDVIFLKSRKTMFWGHFWPFLVIFGWWGFFSKKSGKNPALSQWTIHGLYNEPILRKLTERQKDGRTDGRTLFYRTLPVKVGGPKDWNFTIKWKLYFRLRNHKPIMPGVNIIVKHYINLQKSCCKWSVFDHFVDTRSADRNLTYSRVEQV